MEPNMMLGQTSAISKTFWMEAVAILAVIGLAVGGYLYGISIGVQKAETAATLKAKADAAASEKLATQAANPFSTDNPLNSITTNPFK